MFAQKRGLGDHQFMAGVNRLIATVDFRIARDRVTREAPQRRISPSDIVLPAKL